MDASSASLAGLLRPSEAAAVLRISSKRIGQLAQDGRLPSTLTPYGRLFRFEDVEALRRERARKAKVRELRLRWPPETPDEVEVSDDEE